MGESVERRSSTARAPSVFKPFDAFDKSHCAEQSDAFWQRSGKKLIQKTPKLSFYMVS
jgi:hypothetical protein